EGGSPGAAGNPQTSERAQTLCRSYSSNGVRSILCVGRYQEGSMQDSGAPSALPLPRLKLSWVIALAVVSGQVALERACVMGGGEESSDDQAVETNLNLRLPTLGGRQFWGDVRYICGWRIQHHVVLD